MAVAVIALVTATTGGAFAATATSAKKKSSKHADAKQDIALIKAQADTLRGAKGATGPAGAPGATGATGATGAAGLPATKLWAVVAGDGSVLAQSGLTSVTRTASGRYTVKFNQSVAGCAWIGSVGARNNGTQTGASVSLNGGSSTPVDSIRVATFFTATDSDETFNVAVFC